MTSEELLHIFKTSGEELVNETSIEEVKHSLKEKFTSASPSVEDLIATSIIISGQLQQKFLLKVLEKALCNESASLSTDKSS